MNVRAVAVVLFVAVSVLGPIGAAVPAGTSGSVAQPASNNSSMGSQVSSFMQSSAGETGGAVESGMWEAGVDDGNVSEASVQRRADALQAQLASLEQRKRTLVERRRNGTIGDAEFRARMSRLVGRMAALNESIDALADRARAADVATADVRKLRQDARNVSGGAMASVARSMAGGPPAGLPDAANRSNGDGPGGDNGPPDRSGPPDDNETRPGNGTAPNNGTGTNNGTPPDHAANPDNETPANDTTPPDHAANPDNETPANDTTPPDGTTGPDAGDTGVSTSTTRADGGGPASVEPRTRRAARA
ncbi:MAG: hypothetical protein V5A37_03900 [Halobacteriales archaeon]